MSQLIPIDEVVYFDVITSNPSTGAVSDADSTPTFDVYEEAVDTGMLGATNLTKRTSLTGDYRGSFTASAVNGFEAGKWYSVIASATVNAVAGKTVALHFRVAPVESQAGVPKADAAYVEGLDATNQIRDSIVTDATRFAGANIDAAISSRLAPTVAARTLDVSATGEAGIDWGNIGSPTTAQGLSGTTISTTQAVASVSGAVGSVTGGVTVTTNNDKTGYGLSAAAVQAIWDALTTALTTVGSIGKRLADNVDAAVSSRLASAGYTTPPTVVQIRTEMDANSTKLANLDTTISSRSTLTAAGVWDALLTGIATVGSIGKLIKDNLDALISSRAPASTAVSNVDYTGVRAAKLDNLDATISSRLAAAGYTAPDNTTIGTINTKLGTPAGASVSADVAALQADTDNIQTRLPAALTADGNMKGDALRINGNALASAQLALSAAVITSGAAVAGTLSTTQMSTNLTEATNDHYKGQIIKWTSGALLGQATDITAYNGTSKVLTYTAVTDVPGVGDAFVIM